MCEISLTDIFVVYESGQDQYWTRYQKKMGENIKEQIQLDPVTNVYKVVLLKKLLCILCEKKVVGRKRTQNLVWCATLMQ